MRPGTVHLDTHGGRFVHEHAAIRKGGDRSRGAEFDRSRGAETRPFAPPPQRPHIGAGRVKDLDMLSLCVQHVHVPVVVHRERADCSETGTPPARPVHRSQTPARGWLPHPTRCPTACAPRWCRRAFLPAVRAAARFRWTAQGHLRCKRPGQPWPERLPRSSSTFDLRCFHVCQSDDDGDWDRCCQNGKRGCGFPLPSTHHNPVAHHALDLQFVPAYRPHMLAIEDRHCR